MKRYTEQIKFKFTHAKPLEVLAYCKKCKKAGVSGKNIINGYHDSCYESHKCPKCHKTKSSSGKCCTTTCMRCFGAKPKDKKSCEACRIARIEKRRKIRDIQRRIGTVRYENVTPELIELMRYGKLPDMKRNNGQLKENRRNAKK